MTEKKEELITQYIRVKDVPVDKEVGIEIELEGEGLFGIAPDAMWKIEPDGSLRGESAEFVLKAPCKRTLVPIRLRRFRNLIKTIKVIDSGRAGIHVHINVQDMTPKEVVQFICLYMVFEDILVNWCGDSRVGNLFCLRTCDAPFSMKVMRSVIKTGNWCDLRDDRNRYSSLNLKAIPQYGSVEFRAMRSTDDIKLIQCWINILTTLKDRSREFSDPKDIVEQVSFRTTERFFEDILGDVKVEPPLLYDHDSMMQGVRHAQFIAYVPGHWNNPVKKYRRRTTY